MIRTRTSIWVQSVVEVGYVATVAILALVATTDPTHIAYPAFDLTLGLSVPSLVLLSPAFYAVVGNAWHLTGADNGGITWPVTAAYVVMFTAAAVLNVVLANLAVQARRRRREARRWTPPAR